MNKFDLEKYKKEKEEYDKNIRSFDYKVVETSVDMYNAKSHNSQFVEDDENSIVTKLKNKIDYYELEKANLTKEIWNKVVSIKEKLREIINNKIIENPSEKNDYLIAIFKINKITDVYFNVDELLELAYLLEDTTNENITEPIEKKTEVKVLEKTPIEKELGEEKEQVFLIKNNNSLLQINKKKKLVIISKPIIEKKKEIIPEETLENKLEKVKTVQIFNIEEQRVIDFENLLNHIEKTSKDYRTDIESALNRFMTNYKIVKNAQYLQNDFDNITNNYLEIFKKVISKFKKDESLEALESRIKTQKEQINELDKRILNNNIAMKEFQRQMQELAKVYFVKNYVKKVQAQVAKAQGSQETNEKDTINVNNIFVPKKDNINNVENNVFLKIKKLSYDKRMNHIIEVSKWTKNVEEEIKYSDFEESDFQFVIYLIRQTENVCNSNFEQIANLIINLCDSNLQLEDIEKEEKSRNRRLQDEEITTQILKVGIENIKKRYSKIPFIGRKVSSILSVKMLNK